MQIERTKNAVKNSVSGIIYRVVCLLFPFAIRTILIRKLGIEYAGLGSLFTSLLQVLSLSELGFSTVVAFAMYKPVAEDNRPLVCALLGFIRKVYYIVGAAILVAGLAVTPFLPKLIKGEAPADINLYILYFIYLANTVVSYFVFAYKSVLLAAFQRNDIENVIMTISYIAMYVLQVAVLLIFKNYYVYIVFLPLCTLSVNLARSAYVNKKYPDYKAEDTLGEAEKKAVFKNIGAMIGHRLSGTVIFSGTNIVISSRLGLETLGVYNNYFYIVNSLIAIISVLYTALTAGIGNNIVTADVKKNYDDFNTLTFLNVWLVGWMSVTLLCLFQHFMRIWMNGDEAKMLGNSSAFLFALLLYLWKFKDILSTYKDAAGMWKDDFFKPYTVAAVTLLLSLALIGKMGVNGAIVATIAGVFVVSMPWETHAFFKNYFGFSSAKYYLRMLLYTMVVAAAGALTCFVCFKLPETGVLWLLLKGAICIALPNAVFLSVSFKTREFKVVLEKIKYLIKWK